jgi:hypothetical protein
MDSHLAYLLSRFNIPAVHEMVRLPSSRYKRLPVIAISVVAKPFCVFAVWLHVRLG